MPPASEHFLVARGGVLAQEQGWDDFGEDQPFAVSANPEAAYNLVNRQLEENDLCMTPATGGVDSDLLRIQFTVQCVRPGAQMQIDDDASGILHAFATMRLQS